MKYIYDPEKQDELMKMLNDDDSIIISGKDFKELAASIRKKGRGRKPITMDDDLFDLVVRRWQSGEMTARAAMDELGLKPNTFYRRVKERYGDMNELKKELREAAKAEKAELKELKKQVKAESREIRKMVEEKADETISAHKMEKEILKEKIEAEHDYRKEMRNLHKEVAAEAEAIKESL